MCILVPACSVSCRLVYSLLPGVSVSLPSLVIIKDYYFEFTPRLSLFLPAVCTMTEDQTKKVSGAPSPRFVLFVFESLLFWFLGLSVPRKGICRSSSRLSPHARRSWEISAADCGYPKPAGWLSNSRVAAPPSPPFAGVQAAVRGSPSRYSREMTPPSAAHRACRSREFTPPSAAHRARRSREMTPPSAAHRARRSRDMTAPSAAHRARRLLEITPPSAAHPGPPFTGDHTAGRR